MMKAVVLQVSEEDLARRRKLGLDRRDEMWEGVLHIAPAPSYEHQRMLDELTLFLGALLKRTKRGTLRSGINVFSDKVPVPDYRIPDHTFVAAGREGIIAPDGIRGGGPDAVIEVRSPEDESYEKMSFFAGLGVREVLVLDRDTKKPGVYRLAGGGYVAVSADAAGWVVSETMRVRFRRRAGPPPRLELEDLDDPASRAEI
jgi:Uma2 family endonuclease